MSAAGSLFTFGMVKRTVSSKIWWSVFVITSIKAVQVFSDDVSSGRQFDLLTPSTFGYDTKLFMGASVAGGVEVLTVDSTGSTTSVASSTTASSTSSSDTLISLLTSTCSISVKAQLTASHAMDGYLPLPSSLGATEFYVTSWNAGTSFIAIRCGQRRSVVTITVPSSASGSTTVTVADVTLTPGDSTQVQMSAGSELLVTSSGYALDGVRVSATEPVLVLAGNKDINLFNAGQVSTLVEMIPPAGQFSTTYVVQFPAGGAVRMVKVIALADGISVTATQTSGSVSTNTLSLTSDVWTITQLSDLHILASGPVMVTQFVPAATGSGYPSMTLFPPAEKWRSSYLVYPLTPPSTGSHVATIAILTSLVTQLTAIRLTDEADLTSQMTFTAVSTTGYSTGSLTLTDASVISLSLPDGAGTFQVIQYGGLSGTDGAYAFPAGWEYTCTESDSSSTSSNSSSSSNEDILPFMPDVAFYIVLAVVAVAVVAAAVYGAEILRQRAMRNCDKHARKNSSPTAKPYPPGAFVVATGPFILNTLPNGKSGGHSLSSPLRGGKQLPLNAPLDTKYIRVKPFVSNTRL